MSSKTLKTFLAEATLEFLYSRNVAPYMSIDWEMLDANGGLIENAARDESFIVLKLGTHSISNFELADNKFYFSCRFGGKDSACVIPTCAILAIYNNENGQGTAFNIAMDYEIEQAEREHAQQHQGTIAITKKDEDKKPVKRVSHLTVVK